MVNSGFVVNDGDARVRGTVKARTIQPVGEMNQQMSLGLDITAEGMLLLWATWG